MLNQGFRPFNGQTRASLPLESILAAAAGQTLHQPCALAMKKRLATKNILKGRIAWRVIWVRDRNLFNHFRVCLATQLSLLCRLQT